MAKSLQIKVLERYMTASELEAFLERYNLNRKTLGSGVNRFDFMSASLTESELEQIREYTTNREISVPELARKYGKNPSSYGNYIARLALKKIYQG